MSAVSRYNVVLITYNYLIDADFADTNVIKTLRIKIYVTQKPLART